MKTYILDTVERVRRYSQSLDVKTILCSKAWYVLNEGGDAENLIFQPDGSILVSVNGSTRKYTWQYIPQNQSLNIMHSESEGTMLKPAFIDGTILAFNKIGTKECMFLIDDSIDESKKICSLDSVKKYLMKVEAEEIKKTKKIEAQKKEEEQQRLLILQEKNRIEEEGKVKEEQRRTEIINSYAAKEKRLKEENTYEAYSRWYSILRCTDVHIDIFMSASFYLIWAGLCIIVGGSLILILVNKPSTTLAILAVLSPAIMFPIAIMLSGYFERWRMYKKHKKYYDEYTKKNKEYIDNFSFKVFYDIKYSYESLVQELSELEKEKEEALNA